MDRLELVVDECDIDERQEVPLAVDKLEEPSEGRPDVLWRWWNESGVVGVPRFAELEPPDVGEETDAVEETEEIAYRAD